MTSKEKGLTKLVIASGNLGKVQEYQAYLIDLGWFLLPKPEELEVEETENTFMANARLKASQVAISTGEWALADDSGLEVVALDNAPGVFSARYGENDQERIERLLFELGNELDRDARFVCAIAVSNPTGEIVAEALGTCEGEILHAPRGENGFGYDPIFYVPEHAMSFAQMPAELKAKISHRAHALEILLPKLKQLGLTDNTHKFR